MCVAKKKRASRLVWSTEKKQFHVLFYIHNKYKE